MQTIGFLNRILPQFEKKIASRMSFTFLLDWQNAFLSIIDKPAERKKYVKRNFDTVHVDEIAKSLNSMPSKDLLVLDGLNSLQKKLNVAFK